MMISTRQLKPNDETLTPQSFERQKRKQMNKYRKPRPKKASLHIPEDKDKRLNASQINKSEAPHL